MFNQVFSILGCPFCLETKKAVILSNLDLPIEKHIYQQDIHLGDSSISLLDKKYPMGRFPMPTILLDRRILFNGKMKMGRSMLISSSIKELDSQIFKELLV